MALLNHWSGAIDHGGQLALFIQKFGRSKDQWIDLSSAINPVSWLHNQDSRSLIGACQADQWPCYDQLIKAAKRYYGCQHLVPATGSQTIIELLPYLWQRKQRVLIVSPTYSSHVLSWQKNHQVIEVGLGDIESHLSRADVVVIVNPNNPTGHVFDPKQLLEYQRFLSAHGGTLIVDEAFIDTSPNHSLAAYTDQSNLIVLRSVGKFFGVPGLRLGFLLANSPICEAFSNILGCWSVNVFAAHCGMLMLGDDLWQNHTRHQIFDIKAKMRRVLVEQGWSLSGEHDLFFYFSHKQVLPQFEFLAERGVALRAFNSCQSMRMGLCQPNQYERWQQIIKGYEQVL